MLSQGRITGRPHPQAALIALTCLWPQALCPLPCGRMPVFPTSSLRVYMKEEKEEDLKGEF